MIEAQADAIAVMREAERIDPLIWQQDGPAMPTRACVVTFHERRQASIAQARVALSKHREAANG